MRDVVILFVHLIVTARQAPQLLKALREMALIQSVESSNRIEGVMVAPERLVPLVVGNAKPRNRSEEEIRGYRRALSLIHTDAEKLEITPDLLRQLHETTQEGAFDEASGNKRTTRSSSSARTHHRRFVFDQFPLLTHPRLLRNCVFLTEQA